MATRAGCPVVRPRMRLPVALPTGSLPPHTLHAAPPLAGGLGAGGRCVTCMGGFGGFAAP